MKILTVRPPGPFFFTPLKAHWFKSNNYFWPKVIVPIFMKPNLVVVTGPTAIGKTSVSISIAQHFGTEIISADSRQLFREMVIGTAVPDHDELMLVPHHFIHTQSIFDYYNASRFELEVLEKLSLLFKKNDLVVMTGGSMLYIDAVCNGIDDLPAIDFRIREQVIEQFHNEGLEPLKAELKTLDPEYYSQVDLKNPKRIMHAIEICRMTGKTFTSFRTNKKKERPFDLIKIGLTASREILYDRINRRVEAMIEAGLEEEAKRLFEHRENNALNTVGYREWFEHFEGSITREEAIEKIKSNTRRYARKQQTWFKRDQDIRWFDISDKDLIIPAILQKMNNPWKKQENL